VFLASDWKFTGLVTASRHGALLNKQSDPAMLWGTKAREFDLHKRALIMGILNVTTDSFSDGGRYLDLERAVAHAQEMAAAGTDIIDVGGESTRPGAEPVLEDEELRRVLPVIERLANDPRYVISIDTMKPAVARAAVERGAAIINDVTGLRDPAMREVVRDSGAGAIAMHMQGAPRDMQRAPHYGDVVAEIKDFFRQTLDACLASGVDVMRLAFDPGIGFGKTVPHNLAILRNLDSMRVGGRPLVLGVSRKSFLGKLVGSESLDDRVWPTVALTSYGWTRGANILRVHDVLPNAQALRMTEALLTP
jgi:dihydropteroate synthase